MKKYFLLPVVFLFLASCAPQKWQRTDDGVIVNSPDPTGKGAGKIIVEVVNERIFHVKAAPGNYFSKEKSLCVVNNSRSADFETTEKGGSLLLSTSEIKAEISLETGRIIFRDKNDKILLAEPESGGKAFTPVKVEGTSGWSMSQVFKSPADEAFYGLGQHQSDEFNYKGLNESLYQYNTKVSIPFVVSNRNYGLLWDNYSLTKFGDPRNYSDMDLFKLYDENGEEGGLTATYYVNSDPNNVFIKRKESAIDYENLTTIKEIS